MAARRQQGGIVQADLSPTESLGAPAAPVDTYQQQATSKTDATSVGGQFLEGLGKLAAPTATAITNYDAQEGDKQEAEAKMRALAATPEELRQEIASGNYFGQPHRRAQSALRVLDAGNRVFDASRELDDMKTRGELVGPEADGKVAGTIAAHAAAVADDPLAQRQFQSAMLPVLQKYTNDAHHAAVLQAESDKATQLYTYTKGLGEQIERDYPGTEGVAGNNPGNIRSSDYGMALPGAVGKRGKDGGFVMFDSIASGYRAANANLDNYARKGFTTPAQIISRWAPPSENDTATYIKQMSDWTGFDPNTPLPNDPASRAKFLAAMTRKEHGKAYAPEQVQGWLTGDNAGPDDKAAYYKSAVFKTADFAKNDLLMSPEAIEGTVTQLAKHYAATGNLTAFDQVGRFDRNGQPLAEKLGPQWDEWRKRAEATSDSEKKKTVASSVDALEAAAVKGDGTAASYNADVDRAFQSDPDNFGAARAERLKASFARGVEARTQAATQALADQQEKATQREFIEHGAERLLSGNGYVLPTEERFTAADGKERVFATKDYRERMFRRGEARIDEQGQRESWDADTILRAKTKLYASNGEGAHPVFQRSFADLFNGSKAGVPADPKTLPQRLGQLEFLRANDPGSFVSLAGKGSSTDKMQETWLTAYDAARSYGSEPERAYAIATQRTFSPSGMDRISGTDRQAKIDEVTKRWTEKGMFGGGMGVVPGALARSKASQAVDLAIAAGVADKDITDKAAERLGASHLIVNGVPVHNNLPGISRPEVATEYLKDGVDIYKSTLGPGMAHLRDLPLAFADDPGKQGSYTLIRTDTGERLTRPGQPDSSITGQRLLDYVMQHRNLDSAKTKAARDKLGAMEDGTIAPATPREETPEEAGERGQRTRAAIADVAGKLLGGERGPDAPFTDKDLRGD